MSTTRVAPPPLTISLNWPPDAPRAPSQRTQAVAKDSLHLCDGYLECVGGRNRCGLQVLRGRKQVLQIPRDDEDMLQQQSARYSRLLSSASSLYTAPTGPSPALLHLYTAPSCLHIVSVSVYLHLSSSSRLTGHALVSTSPR